MQQGTTTRQTPSSRLPQYGTSAGIIPGVPFKVIPIKDDIVKVSYFSSLLENFDIKNFIPIVGLDYEFKIKYGDKIYVVIYFDKNLQVVSAQLRHDNLWWSSKTKRVKLDGSIEEVPVYPNEIELISKLDLIKKNEEIQNDITRLREDFSAQIAIVQAKVTAEPPELTEQQAATKIAQLTKQFEENVEKFIKLGTTIAQFFGSTPSRGIDLNTTAGKAQASGVKKQFKAYKLVAYTTKDLDAQLTGSIIYPVPTGDPFKLIQCLSNDLMLVDSCINEIGCRLPIPWSRPVYYYSIDDNGTAEDDKSIKI